MWGSAYDKEIKALKQSYEDKSDDLDRLERNLRNTYSDRTDVKERQLEKESRANVFALEDRVTDLTAQVFKLTALKQNANSQFDTKLELDRRKVELDNREKLLRIDAEHFVKSKKAGEEDIAHHHDELLELISDAKEELNNAKSDSRKAGYAEGYSAGLIDGIKRPAELIREERQALSQIVNAALVGMGMTNGGTGEPSKAYQELAEGYSKNFSTLVAKVVTDSKTVIVKE